MTVAVASAAAPDFEALFAASDDPWGYRSRWYEARKRALTLAALPRPRYARGFEPGCATAELGVALAGRCDALLLADGSARAVELARARAAGLAHVEVQRLQLPGEWPADHHRFDLVVFSEIGYYLEPAALQTVVDRIRSSLAPDATVLACHWQRPIADARCDAEAVHSVLDARLGLAHTGGWLDADFRIDVWTADPRSVAQRDGVPA